MIPRFKCRHGKHRGKFFIFSQIKKIYNRFAATGTAGLWNVVYLAPIHPALVGEKNKGVVGGGHKKVGDKIVVLNAHGCLTLAAPVLLPIKGNRIPFYIAAL